MASADDDRSTPPHQALQALLDALSIDGYAVAKAPDLWGNLERGGDWDLVVLDPPRAYRLLRELVGLPQVVERRSYVWCTYYRWGEIDFLPNIQWRGLTLVEGREVIADRRRNAAGVYEARPAHQAIAAVIQPLMAAGTYKPRYEPLWLSAAGEDALELRRCLTRSFGEQTARSVLSGLLPDRASQRALRRAAVRQAARAPLSNLRAFSRFAALEVGLRSRHLVARLESAFQQAWGSKGRV